MSEDSKPFFTSTPDDLISDKYPDLESLSVSVVINKEVERQIGYRSYNEKHAVSHVECPECGRYVAIGVVIENHLDDKETDFQHTKSCGGETEEGESCLVTFDIQGTAEYV